MTGNFFEMGEWGKRDFFEGGRGNGNYGISSRADGEWGLRDFFKGGRGNRAGRE